MVPRGVSPACPERADQHEGLLGRGEHFRGEWADQLLRQQRQVAAAYSEWTDHRVAWFELGRLGVGGGRSERAADAARAIRIPIELPGGVERAFASELPREHLLGCAEDLGR